MKKKYKVHGRNDFLHNTLSIPQFYQDRVITREITELVYKFEHAKTVEEQVIIIPQLTEHIKPPASHDMDAIISILTHLLIKSPPKHPVKKSITRIFTNLQNVSELFKNISLHIAKQLLQQIISLEVLLEDFVYKIEEFEQINSIINVINGCYENFPPGQMAVSYSVSEVYSFLVRTFYSFTDHLETMKSPVILQKLYQFIHNTTRGLISTSQQFIVSRSLYKTYKVGLYNRCLAIINNMNIPYDTKSNCGIIMVTVANSTKENGYENLLQICLEPEIPWYFQDIEVSKITTEIGVICIFSGILNIIKPKQLVLYNSTSLYLITSRLTDILACSSHNPSIILGVNRTMLLVSRNICQLEIEHLLKLLNILLNYVWMNLDHGMDTVRHIARSIYINLLKICVHHHDKGNSSVLDNLIKKTLALPPQRTCRYKALTTFANEVGTKLLLQNEQNLVQNLLKLSQAEINSVHVLSSYESLMKNHIKEIDEESWVDIWVQPLLLKLGNNSEEEDNTGLQDLLTTAIKLKPMLLQNIIPERSLENPSEFCSLLKCALIARQIGTSCNNESNLWRGLLHPIILEEAMYHQSDEIRTLSLALVCDSHKSTEIFNNWELNFIIKFLGYNLGTFLPSVRQQILSSMKKIMTRFNESYKLIIRCLQKYSLSEKHIKQADVLQQQKEYYEDFINKLRRCIFENLFHGANFTRRMLCLDIFRMLRPIYESVIEEWNSEECDALLLCLSDSYENNKILAVQLLTHCPIELMKFDDLSRTTRFIEDSIKLASSVRPSDTITAAYMLETVTLSPIIQPILLSLLSVPEKKHNYYSTDYLMTRFILTALRCQLLLAQTNLMEAAKQAPLHGMLFCLRHLMEKYISKITRPYWRPLLSELIKVCLELDNTVAPIVKNSSPEGHLPMDQEPINDDFNTDETVTAQMLLVCAWRTVKEVSLLLSEICLKGSIVSENECGLITQEQVIIIGDHFTQLLTETRHRGAFEHAYIGFSRLCNRLWKCNSPKLHYLPIQWLNEIMNIIAGENQKNNVKLCETRRSAGLPFMIQAIVSSELNSGGSNNFKNCIFKLLDFGQYSKKVETRTHAMNILRALYRHTQLGEIVMPHVADGFICAITGFTESTWSERNSATLLFASLMTRTFGVQRNRDIDKLSVKNRMTVRTFNQKYPSLLNFLLKELKGATMSFTTTNEEILYPVLILMARLYPICIDEDSNDSLVEFIPYIKLCAQGRILRTRELAAKALSSILYEPMKIQVLKELFFELESVTNNNYLHGILLQISQILSDTTNIDRDLDITNVIESTQWIMNTKCPIVAALYMQILVQLTIKIVEKKTNYICATLLNDIDSILEKDTLIGNSIFLRSAYHLKLHLVAHVMNSPMDLKCLRLKEIIFKSFSYENPIIHDFSLNFLIYLLSPDKNSVIVKSWDMPQEETFLIDLLPETMQQMIFNTINDDLESLGSILQPYMGRNDGFTSKSFAVMSFFPNVLEKMSPTFDNSEIFYLIEKNKDNCDNNMNCAIMCCLKSMFRENAISDNRRFAKLIYEFSSSNYSTSCRYTVALILTENAHLLTSAVIDGVSVCILWQTVMQLLADSELVVRNTISNLTQLITKNSLPVVPERAREVLLQYFVDSVNNISEVLCISLLLFWIFEDDEEAEEEYEGQIFEKGEGNTYVESECLSKLASKKLPQFFRGREISFFITFSNILENSNLKIFWNITEEQKRVFTIYCNKIDQELKKTNSFSTVRNFIKNDIDFWTYGEESMKWRFLDILDSFSGYT